MKYAPVVITTVCRFNHFKSCLESLSYCTWADKTDVYIAVDYPGKVEHQRGYRLIVDYLKNCRNLSFNSLNVIYRETNYFYSGKDNVGSLTKEVLKKYDRVIISEDDNIFSPSFLVYMNKGLEKFENDDSVISINGYRHFYPIQFENNTFFRQNVDFSAWGFGIWKNRYEKILDLNARNYFCEKFCLSNFVKVLKNGNNRAINFLNLCNSINPSFDDTTLSVVMALENMDVVMPKVSLVRNIGWDGSGEHCSTKNQDLAYRHLNQEISLDRGFVFVGTGFEKYKKNRKIYINNSYGKQSWIMMIKNLIYFLFNRNNN